MIVNAINDFLRDFLGDRLHAEPSLHRPELAEARLGYRRDCTLHINGPSLDRCAGGTKHRTTVSFKLEAQDGWLPRHSVGPAEQLPGVHPSGVRPFEVVPTSREKNLDSPSVRDRTIWFSSERVAKFVRYR